MINTAIVGLGWWGKTLVKAAADFGAPLRFVRGVTLEPDAVRDFAGEHKIALSTSIDDVLGDKSIQAVVLATPHTKHRAQVEAIAATGKHIYCEKPFALSKADARAALDACERAGIVIAVGHHFRLMPSMRVLAELKEAGAFGTIMSSWATRVRRDDLMSFAIDGTGGSAVAGLHRCRVQSAAATPTVKHFNPTVDLGIDYREGWSDAPDAGPYANPYRVGWEDFLRHLVTGALLRSDLAAGVRDLLFAEACQRSAASGAWVDLENTA